MGQRNIIETSIDPKIVHLGNHTGNNSTVASAAFDNLGENQQCILVQYGAWNAADTVVGGFVEIGLQHSDDTVASSFVDVPNVEMSVNGRDGLVGASTVSGGAATGVIVSIPKDAVAGVAKASYLGNKRYIRIKRTTQTNIANGFIVGATLLGAPNIQPKGYNHKQ
jgi:hypothetical protein